MDEFLWVGILDELDEEEHEGVEGAAPLMQRNVEELSDRQFVRLFRVTKALFYFIVQLLTPYLRPQRRHTDLDIPTRILAALKFYAAGSYQTDVGCNWFIGLSQSSVSRALTEVTNAFNQPAVLNEFVHFPSNLQEFRNSRRNFFEEFDFPGIVGCIDCTHVAIFPPNRNNPEAPEHIFVNRKNYHSINVQLICDHRLRILNVCANYPGSTHDAFIWNNSPVNQVMQDLHRAGHSDFFLLGDSGYPLRPWLLTPMQQEPPPDSPEYRYNEAHKRVRSIIERCNGVLKARFRCCLKHRVLHYAPDVAGRIINACVILHNMCIEHNIPEPEQEEEEMQDPENGLFGDALVEGENAGARAHRNVNPDLEAGRNARARVIATRFQD